jgi:Type I phosphodiesterase / nucleotide pyrophosphatase
MSAPQPSGQLLFLELNEVNFGAMESYFAQGKLPRLAAFLNRHGYHETTSEETYELLEPWIQWVTAHTGLSYREHGIFRLGDMIHSEHQQIWERLEQAGLKVGAISPMNARNNLRSAAFFVPDPWTSTRVDAPAAYRKLYAAIARAVSDNAEAKLDARSLMHLLAGTTRAARPANYGRYMAYALAARRKPWLRAAFLDQLLADMFIGMTRKTQPNFATLFLNGAAHIQHHYMFSSAAYQGPLRNPSWYIRDGDDPVLDIYSLYDRILGQVQDVFPQYRIMLATGLHQDAHAQVTYYWRFKDHAAFLKRIGIDFATVEPRMSRDFLITFRDPAQAAAAERRLAAARAGDGAPLFETDNRGDSLFVSLIYAGDITPELVFSIGNESFSGLRDDVAFVALKNGEHNGIGYFADSGLDNDGQVARFPLTEVPDRVLAAVA